MHYPGGYIPLPYYPYYPLYDPTSYYGYTPKHHHRAALRSFYARGGLVLETIPDLAQVYVDGFYVGLAGEFGLRGRALDLTEGPHHVELRAPGYDALTFSVMIEPNGILRYRGDMQMIPPAAPVARVIPAAPVSPKSYYVIPNCYAGDKPPTGQLPKGCNLKNLKTRK
jgi:PEGA domain